MTIYICHNYNDLIDHWTLTHSDKCKWQRNENWLSVSNLSFYQTPFLSEISIRYAISDDEQIWDMQNLKKISFMFLNPITMNSGRSRLHNIHFRQFVYTIKRENSRLKGRHFHT